MSSRYFQMTQHRILSRDMHTKENHLNFRYDSTLGICDDACVAY